MAETFFFFFCNIKYFFLLTPKGCFANMLTVTGTINHHSDAQAGTQHSIQT